MAIALKLNELMLFEDVAGTSFAWARTRMVPRLCQRHRLVTAACKECASKGVPCEQHADWQVCPECELPDMPTKWIAALGWIARKRSQPELTFDEYAATADIEQAMEEIDLLGNAVAGEATVSPASTRRGSRRSSISIPG